MQLLLSFLLFLCLPLSIDSRGGRGGGGRGRVTGARGRSRSGSSWGYGQKNAHRPAYSVSASGMGNRVSGGGSGGGQTYVRKTPSSLYRAGVSSSHSSNLAKTSIALAAYPLATRVFGNNVIREREHPLKVDGKSYYWSASFVPQSSASTVCSLTVDPKDPLFSNITFTNLEKVSELAWSCLSTSYCCGLSCCHTGYDGSPLGIVGSIGAGLLSLTALLIPGLALLNTLVLVNDPCRGNGLE